MEPEIKTKAQRKWTIGAPRALWGTTVFCLLITGVAVWYQRRPAAAVFTAQESVSRPNRLVFSPEGGAKYLAAAFSDGRIRLWETLTQREVTVKLPSRWPLNDLAWASDGGSVFTGGFEQHLLAFHIQSLRVGTWPKFAAPIVSVTVSPGKPELLAALANGELWWLNLQTEERALVSSSHQGIVKVVRYHPQGQWFITAGADHQLNWHDAGTRAVSRTVNAHQHEVSCLGFSPDGTRLASGSWDNTVKIWQAESGTPVATLPHPEGVAEVGWRGLDVVSSCWDGQLRIWNVSTATVFSERACRSDSLAFAVCPGRELIAEVDSAGTLHLEAP